MGKLKQAIIDTGAEGVAIAMDIPDSVYQEAVVDEAQRILQEKAIEQDVETA